MTSFPERVEKLQEIGVQHVPETPNVPEHLSEHIEKVETNFTAQVKDNAGNPVMQTPQNSTQQVKIQGDQIILTKQSKGSIIDSLTWRAMYFLRQIAKQFIH